MNRTAGTERSIPAEQKDATTPSALRKILDSQTGVRASLVVPPHW